MPFFYVYSPDDFVGGLPSESTNATSGWNSLTLKPGATPTLIEMVDDDGNFDESMRFRFWQVISTLMVPPTPPGRPYIRPMT